MKGRALRTVLVMAVALGLMVVTAIPSHANVGTTDVACDVVDPVTGVHPVQPTVAGKGYHTCDAAEVDLRSWNVSSAPIGGRPGIKAYFKVNTGLPQVGVIPTAPRTNPYASFNGYTFHGNFQNPNIQDNNPAGHVTGMRAPLCTTPIYSNLTGHYANHYWFQVGVSLTYGGGEYKATPFISQYDPNLDGGFTFHDFNANPDLTAGTHFRWGYVNSSSGLDEPATWNGSKWVHPNSSGSSTIYVHVPTKFPTRNTQGCDSDGNGFGDITQEYAKTGDPIRNTWAASWLNQVVVLPVVIPLSVVPGEGDIDAIGGFIYRADWSPDSAYNPHPNGLVAVGSEHLGTVNVPGHDCWTPTVGGVLPSNPLHSPGNPCGVNNPVGSQYTWSGLNFTL